MNYADQERERAKIRASPDDFDESDAAAELARLWIEYLRDQDVDLSDDRTVRYWREIDRPADSEAEDEP